ncbi:glycoside hydrolase/deacetylase [Anaeromyces robustus]|nr:glycoside hydrolase/deacetylase [Anaeromyces robustus]|eukprot:ORX43730.1 glycoside hydrolase/deacetylase [Anaeromyces robustus]
MKMHIFLCIVLLVINACIVASITLKNDKAPVYENCTNPGQFVLTFDDGPNPRTTSIALKTLKEHNIKATFFINAVNYGNLEEDSRSIEMVKTIFEEGHDIGSHTYYHEDLFTAIQKGTMEINIDNMTDIIDNIIGVKPTFFRPPGGYGGYKEIEPEKIEMTEKIQKYLGSHGYNIIMWNTNTKDWSYKDDVDKVIENLNIQLKAPDVSPKTHSFIALLHDVHPTTVNNILPAVIEYVKDLGYKFVSLSECIEVSPYQGINFENKNDESSKLKNMENSTIPSINTNSSFSIQDNNSGSFSFISNIYNLNIIYYFIFIYLLLSIF